MQTCPRWTEGELTSIYIYVYIYIHTIEVHVPIYIYIYTHVHRCMHTCIHTYINACTHMSICFCVHISYMYIVSLINFFVYVYMYAYTASSCTCTGFVCDHMSKLATVDKIGGKILKADLGFVRADDGWHDFLNQLGSSIFTCRVCGESP